VLAFELVSGSPPFMHEDRMVMYRRIVDGVYTCPGHFSAVRCDGVLRVAQAGVRAVLPLPAQPQEGLRAPATCPRKLF
jgi:hypothetical protein